MNRTGGVLVIRHPLEFDFDRAPACVGEIEIDAIFMLGDPDVDGNFGAIELRLCLDVIKSRGYGCCARRLPGRGVVPSP